MADEQQLYGEIVYDASKANSELDKLIATLEKLGGTLKLSTDFTGFVNDMKTVSSELNKINLIDFDPFEQNVGKLAKSLEPLKGFRSQAGSTMSAFKGMAGAISDFNNVTDADFEKFGVQVGKLKTALDSLDGTKLTIGNTLKQLSRVKEVANELQTADLSMETGMGGQLSDLAKGLSKLDGIRLSIGGPLEQLSRLNQTADAVSSKNVSKLSAGIAQLVPAMNQLNSIQSSKLSSHLKQLQKLPQITNQIDDDTLKQFAYKIDMVTAALQPLSKELYVINNGLYGLPRMMRNVIATSNSMARNMEKAGRSTGILSSNLATNISRFTVITFAVHNVANAFRELWDESNNYVETLNLFTVTMGEGAEAAQNYAEKVEDAMGINIADWMSTQGSMHSMVEGFDVAADHAEIMSRNLTQLSYDMSSFYNVSQEVASEKLMAGMSGEIEPLKRWGFALTEAALQQVALEKGITKSIHKMTEEEKVYLRYIAIMDRSAKITGDLGRTMATPANSLRMLSSEMAELKRHAGSIVSVLITQFLPTIHAVVHATADAAEKLAMFFGYELPEIEMPDETPISDTAKDLANGEKSAEKIKNSLMGFDEFNLLGDKSDDADSALDNVFANYPLTDNEDWIVGVEVENEEAYKLMTEFFEWIGENGKLVGGVLGAGIALKLGKTLLSGLSLFSGGGLLKKLLGSDVGDVDKKGLLAKLGEALGKRTGEAKGLEGALSKIKSIAKPALLSLAGLGVSQQGFGGLYKDGVDWLDMTLIAAGFGLMTAGAGVTAAAIGTIATGLYTMADEMGRVRIETEKNKLFNGEGIKVSVIADGFERTMDDLTSWVDPILDATNEMDKFKGKTIESVTKFKDLTAAIESGYVSEELFAGDLKTYLVSTQDNAISYLEAQKDGMNSLLMQLMSGAEDGSEMGAILEAYNEKNAAQIEAIEKAGAEGNMDELLKSMQTTTQTIGQKFATAAELSTLDIDFESPEQMKEAAERINNIYGDTIETLQTGAIESASILAEGLATGSITQAQYDAAMEELKAQTTAQIEEVKKVKADLDKQWEEALIGKTQVETGDPTVDSGNLTVGEIFHAPGQYIPAAMKDVGNTLTEGLKEALATLLGKEYVKEESGEISHVMKVRMELAGATNLKDLVSEEQLLPTTLDIDMDKEISDTLSTWNDTFPGLDTTLNIPIEEIAADVEKRWLEAHPEVGLTVKAQLDTSNLPSGMQTKLGISSVTVPAFANGGTPSMGSLFLANERGPELVGNIGSRTAVMNTNQIVDAVSNGVAKAVSSVLGRASGGNGGTIDVRLNVDGRQIARQVIDQINRTARVNGRSPIAGV